MDADTIEVAKARAVGCYITQSSRQQDTLSIECTGILISVARVDTETVVSESLNFGNARFYDQSAMSCDFIASPCQELSRGDSVMTEETMNAVGVLVTRTVMVKGQCATTVASEK